MTGQHYQSVLRRKHKTLTLNLDVFVEFSRRLHLKFINYFKPPDYHLTYILQDKLHISCKNNDETFLYELKSTITVYDACKKLKKVNDVED